MKDFNFIKRICLSFLLFIMPLFVFAAEKPRWVAQPVYVFIPEYGNISNLMRRAFQEWEDKSGELIRFRFVNKPSNANITVNFVERVTNCNSPLAVGCSRMKQRGGQYYACQLDIAMKRFDNNVYRPIDNIYGVMLHEIGHAIGLGHSQNSKSIMYPYDLPSIQYLTPDDLQLIYKKYH